MATKHIIDCPNCRISIDAEALFRICQHFDQTDWCGEMQVICNNCGKVFEIERYAEIVDNVKVTYKLAGAQASKDRVKAKRIKRRKEEKAKERSEQLEELRDMVLVNANDSSWDYANDSLWKFANSIGEPE